MDQRMIYSLMARSGKVKRDIEAKFFGKHRESRGWYIVAPEHGVFYLHHDGQVKEGVNADSEKPAFWPTEQEAKGFFDTWKLQFNQRL